MIGLFHLECANHDACDKYRDRNGVNTDNDVPNDRHLDHGDHKQNEEYRDELPLQWQLIKNAHRITSPVHCPPLFSGFTLLHI